MKESKILFLGGGNMASEIIRGIRENNVLGAEQITVLDRHPEKLESLHSQYGVLTMNPAEIPAGMKAGDTEFCPDAVLLAVAPAAVPQAISGYHFLIPEDALLISICADLDIASLQKQFKSPRRIMRVMPNTMGLSGNGISALCSSAETSEEDMTFTEKLFSAIGRTCRIREDQFDAFTAFSSAGPAYILEFTAALIDAGVESGLSRDFSRQIVIENLLATAGTLRMSGAHPNVLIDQMTTPGGITIAAVHAMASGGLHAAVMDAVDTALRKTAD